MPDIEELRSIAIEHGVDPTYLDSPDALCARGHRRGDHGDGVAHTACCADLVPKHPLYVPSSRTPTPWVVPDA